VFLNRHGETAALDRLLETVRMGKSRALVIRGEEGVGKTALLDHLVGRASGCRVLRATGVQSEMQFVFAGLHQLCAPVLDRLERLPCPQRDTLATAFGLRTGPSPDRFLVGLAVLGLLAESAGEQPLVCVVDDAQWLDSASAQTLAFVGRRLGAESVALVFAVRDPDEASELADLPQLRVEGLPDAEARTLLTSALHGPVDERVLDRIVAETRGNPLALLELPRGMTPAELAGGFGLPGGQGLPRQIEESYRRQLARLGPDTRRLLLVAAAEPLGDPVLVWRAAERLGIGIEAAAPAADAGLLEIGAMVRFRHPLLRSAVYWAASPEEQRSTHRALAEVTDPEIDPGGHAWHAAQGVAGPAEDVAVELERSAGRARTRGGLAAAAAFLERAAELTLDPARRAQRGLAAAQTRHQAGMPDAALRLLCMAEAGPLDELQRARAELLRGQIALTLGRGSDASTLLLDAAKKLETLDAALARETYLEAIFAGWQAAPSASGASMREAAKAARAAPPAPTPPRAVDLLLDGLATRLTEPNAARAPILRQALRAFRDSPLPAEERLRTFRLTWMAASCLWDEETWETLADRAIQLARDTGALAVLPLALNARIIVHAYLGELTAAASLAEELTVVMEATGTQVASSGPLWLAAWRGHESEALDLIEAAGEEALRRGEGVGLATGQWAAALLFNSLGRYEDGLAKATEVSEQTHLFLPSALGLVELVEAAIRTGHAERATDALRLLAESTRASGTEWALGVEARCRALCSEGQAAEAAYREAIERLGRSRVQGELARAHLLYGEWLRRENRRRDAREQLRAAHEMFLLMGAEAFARRAARELSATGEVVRKQTTHAACALTAQEAQIAHLVRERLSNAEIGARLFISPRTVEWHLNKIFSKLNISSRKQLYHEASP
jgi:DNA-binding CsgD family transcriptional regulator